MSETTDPVVEHGTLSQTISRSVVGDFIVGIYRMPDMIVTGRHTHPQPAINLALGGGVRTTYAGGGLDELLQAGDIDIEPTGAPHMHRFGPKGLYWCTIEVGQSHLDANPKLCQLLSEPRKVIGGPCAFRAREIAGEMPVVDDAGRLCVEANVLELLALFLRSGGSGSMDGSPWIARARDLIAAQLTTSLRLNQIAAEVGVHPVHLSRAFRRSFGITIGEYVRRERVKLGARKLLKTSLSVAAVAQECGFCDESHFIRTFLRYESCTPTQFRQQHAKPR